MKTTRKTILLATICVSAILIAIPAAGRALKKQGSTYITTGFEVSQIESKNLEKGKSSGHIWYTFKASVRNKTNKPYTLSICFQGVDREGYERDEACFYDEYIGKYETRMFTDKKVMDARDYDSIWEWKVDNIRAR